MNGHPEEDVSASCEHVFDQFVTAVTCKSILSTFQQLLDLTGLRHADHRHFYERLKAKLKGSWKAQNLWAKLDKRASHRDYKKGQACSNIRVLIIGSGPCGLRSAIECALLGAKTVIVEKRDRFSRNNVLHLWPYLITDLRNLGAKKFFGKFCAGAIDHISIRQLQCILLKVALLLGVEVHVNVAFEGLIEPPEDQCSNMGWRCRVAPENHALSEYQFDVLVGADGKRNTLPGFKRKEFRGKLAIAVTANFINRNTQAEARVQEISGVAFIFNQKFFMDLKESTRIDLENIVYYKDDTHYFVMTAKKASLLEKGVLKEDYSDTMALLDRSNVNQDALMEYAREAADFSTNYQLPSLDYAVNHYGQADVAMFDFTSMFAAENASRFLLKNGHHLLLGLVGDTLLEPFWPTGSGCARGFLGAFDAAWMIRSWALGKTPLQVLAERESIYTILSQTTPNYLNKNHNMFSIDPNTRYPNLNLKAVKANQVRHLYEGGMLDSKDLEEEDLLMAEPAKKPRNIDISNTDSYTLLRWCQRVLNTGKYRDVHVVDFTSSWRSGLALCALIHSFRPELISNTLLMECDVAANNQMAFNVAEKELGIPPVLTGEDMAKYEVPDKLTMISYLTQFYDLFKHEPLPSTIPLPVKAKRKSLSRDAQQTKSPNKRASFFQKLSAKLAKSNKRKEKEENEQNIVGSKKLKEKERDTVELTHYSKLPMDMITNRLQLDRRTDIKVNKTEEMSGAVSVTAMADLLVAKFKSYESRPPPEPVRRMKGQPSLLAASAASEFCSFCHKRVYIMERMSAEGEFFHRGCLKCDHCSVGLRLTNYSCDRDSKPVKFYCYRHAIPEQRTRPQRKRGLELEENVPDVVITPAPDVDFAQAPKEKSPRKAASAHLTPLIIPKEVTDRPKNTPERVEFEISFDGQEEESEEEQFEHNLRASLSSDTLLDADEDSDSELSDSDLESGAEDEIWENAVGSPTPLTLEQACELHGTWIRQHSQENLLEAVEESRTPSRGPQYSRLSGSNMEEDESSTEVENDSEFQTDDDSSDEEESEEGETEPATGISAEDYTEKSLKSPVSPVSRLSASKASFFSEPPKVVSLDPWSMFGMGKKEAEKDGPENVADVKVTRKKSSASDRKKSSTSESKSVSERRKSSDSKKDRSSKDTDVSESLELDSRSADAFVDKSDLMSAAESLDELKEDFSSDTGKDVKEEQLNLSMDDGENPEGREVTSQEVVESVEEVSDVDQDGDQESEGDDELLEADDEDELQEKEIVSQPSETVLMGSANTDKNDTTEMCLSSKSSKTKKLRMKRHMKHPKEQQMSNSTDSESEPRRPGSTVTDNSQPHSPVVEPADTLLHEDTGKNKLENNSVAERIYPESDKTSEKPAVEETEDLKETPSIEETEGLRATETTAIEETESLKEIPSIEQTESLNETMAPSIEQTEGLKETETLTIEETKSLKEIPSIEQTEGLNATKTPSIEQTEGLKETETDDEGFQQVLESVAAMPGLSDNSDIDDLVICNVDDRFVTSRHKPSHKKASQKIKSPSKQKSDRLGSEFNQQEDEQMNFSFSMPSSSDDSESSSSPEADKLDEQILEVEPGDDDIKPDQDMLRDYTTTMSLALGESYSDEEEDKPQEHVVGNVCTEDAPKEHVVGSECIMEDAPLSSADKEDASSNIEEEQTVLNETSDTANHGSLYLTPNASMENHGNETLSSAPTPTPRRHIQAPELQSSMRADSAQESLVNKTKATTTPSVLTLPDDRGNRDSTGSEIFLTPAESNIEAPFVHKPPSSIPLEEPLSPKPPSVIKASSSSVDPVPSKDPQKPLEKPSSSKSSSVIKISPSADSVSSKDPQKQSTTKQQVPSETTGKSQRKLPELPKLNIPAKEHVQPTKTDSSVDEPIMCSSPKLGSKLMTKSSEVNSNQRNRPLPVPKASNKANTKSNSVTKTTTSKSSNSITAATNKPSNSIETMSKSSSSSSVSQNSVMTKPSSTTMFKPPPAAAAQKTKVPIDKSRLQLGSSSDRLESDHEVDPKKRISADGIVINGTFDDDIPFADESEAEERFYTPSAPEKKERPTFPAVTPGQDTRKKISPGSSAQKCETAAPSVQQKKDASKASKQSHQVAEKANIKAVDQHQTKTPVATVPRSSVSAKSKQSSVKSLGGHAGCNESYETNSTSDIISDSDDNKIQTATSSATEGEKSTPHKGKKTKSKAQKAKIKEKNPESKETKKSLLDFIHPVKTSADGGVVSSFDKSSMGADYNSKIGSKLLKTKKDGDKPLRYVHSRAVDYLDKTPTSENKKDLAICSVFHSEASNRPARSMLGVGAARRTIPLAPKASADEMSDSDESHISLSTMQKRREEDLDERVARRLRKIQQKQQKRAEQKRLRMAQEIQRQLEEVEVKQRELEERGIAVEKALRGDVPDGEDVDESQLMSEWFTLVHEKNALLRYESELNVRAKELELEDRQARLELDFRERTKIPDEAKGESDIAAEGHLLDELLNVVEQRNNLVAMLEEDRLREQKEDSDLKDVMAQKGFVLSPLSFDTRRTKIEAPLVATYAL